MQELHEARTDGMSASLSAPNGDGEDAPRNEYEFEKERFITGLQARTGTKPCQ